MPETLSINNGKNIIRLNATGTDNKNMSLFFPNGKFIYGGKDMPAGTSGATTNQFIVTSYEQPSIELTKINERVFIGASVEVYNTFKESSKNSLGEFVIVVEENNTNKKNSLSGLTPDIIEIIDKLLVKFSLTDTVEIVHRIGNVGKKEIYKKALDIQNEK